MHRLAGRNFDSFAAFNWETMLFPKKIIKTRNAIENLKVSSQNGVMLS